MPVLDKNDKKQVEKYINFVDSSEHGRLTQALEWTFVKTNWKNEVVYLEENGKIIASILLLIKKMPTINYSLIYAPRGPVCDASNIELVKKIVLECNVVAKKYNACMLKFDPSIRYSKELEDMYVQNGFKVSKRNADHDLLIQPHFDAILNIKDKSEDELLKFFSEKTRYNVRLSSKKGVEVYYSRKEEDLKTFYELYKITCKRDKIGERDFLYFKNMLEAYDENHLRIYIAKHENDKLSAAIAIKYGKEMFYLYGASSNEKRNLMPNYLMQWEMIKWALETGCYTYNFGGIIFLDKENGLYKFKTGFCREEGIFEYIGEIDYVYNKLMYFLYVKVLPMLKKIKRFFRELFRKFKH